MIVLDTHALLWWISLDARLSEPARYTIRQELAQESVMVSCITAWEIAMLVSRNRITLALETSAWIATATSIKGLRFIPVDNKIAVGATQLPGNFHKDPADRIIVATARANGAALLTVDKQIRAYPHVTTIW